VSLRYPACQCCTSVCNAHERFSERSRTDLIASQVSAAPPPPRLAVLVRARPRGRVPGHHQSFPGRGDGGSREENSLTRPGRIDIVRQLENNKVNAWKPLAEPRRVPVGVMCRRSAVPRVSCCASPSSQSCGGCSGRCGGWAAAAAAFLLSSPLVFLWPLGANSSWLDQNCRFFGALCSVSRGRRGSVEPRGAAGPRRAALPVGPQTAASRPAPGASPDELRRSEGRGWRHRLGQSESDRTRWLPPPGGEARERGQG